MNNLRSYINDYRFYSEGKYETMLPTRVYKKVICHSKKNNIHDVEAIAELIIPPGSTIIRSYYSYGKMRTDNVYVKNITDLNDQIIDDDFECYSPSMGNLKYNIGSHVKPGKPLDTDLKMTCTSGIHFFLFKKSAKHYLI
ncbi:hypothetical protein [Powai lake megavirus]|uniref:Uncharacterized protein n=1 Tax=Powai lake megavirus TaxID=1842663 RepID=A0A167RQN1_9VIRU|nr:hypothetical protein QJ849_gp855 [Powai lake megavirus]ANB51017.1 hypothetical protein [Powai lake megavirus]